MDIDATSSSEKMDFPADDSEFHGNNSFLVGAQRSELILGTNPLKVDSAEKQTMEADDGHDINFPEVKNQMLKEVEEMKGGVLIDEGVNEDVIEKLLNQKSVEDHTVPIEEDEDEPQANDSESGVKKGPPPEEPITADPDQVGRDEVKASLDDAKMLDVLVCGGCHLTFHFIEEFTKHKSTCSQHSPFVGGMIEQKPTIWAFLLFKNSVVKQNPQKYSGGLTESSWKLYQKWCKLPENTRNAWVTAGESVMKYVTMGNLRKDNTKLSTSLGSDKGSENDIQKRPVIMKKICQRDQSGEITKIRPGGSITQSETKSNESSKTNVEEGGPLIISSSLNTKTNRKPAETIQEEEFVVERIVSRRFNPRRKQYEYLLKWEGYPPEQNTWEPAENLETCQHLLKAFEDSLNKQAMKMKNLQGRKSDFSMTSNSDSSMSNFGRPVRSSKQKALNQVKQWCGSIKPDEAEIETMMKRKLSPLDSEDDDDNFVGKRLRMGSDSEESVGGRSSNRALGGIKKNTPTGQRGPGRPRKYPNTNGVSLANSSMAVESSDEGEGKSTLDILNQANVTKTLNLSPANQQVLVANAKGVVKVDPSQVPNLSSGVYIMSNKSGIIKLDSVSPSKALSMKQGVVKDISPTPKVIGASTPQPSKSVMMLNKTQTPPQLEVPQKSGIVRKSQVTTQVVQRTLPTPPSILPGAKAPIKQPRTTGSIKINTPTSTSRFLQSGTNRQNITITSTNKPKTIIRTAEIQKKVVGSEPRTQVTHTRVERGGILAGSMRGGRGGYSSPVRKVLSKPATVPTVTPIVAPAAPNPPNPLTLCPGTGNVVLKTETPQDTLPPPTVTVAPATQPNDPPEPVVIKEEFVEKMPLETAVETDRMLNQVTQSTTQSLLKPFATKKEPEPAAPKGKKSLVKRTLGKPGSIGSMTVSPTKILPEIEDPESDVVTLSGEDGMIYKVSKSELNNSLLMAGEDGQQCVYLTTGENGDENATVITLDPSSYTEQVNQLNQVNVLGDMGEEEQQFYVKEGEEGELMDIQVQEGADDGQSQLVAQLVEAGEPAPGGGPRRVVLLLPDGNLMMTEVDEEQYAALELDKFQGQTAEME